MPNHFHLLLKQLVEDGISKFMSDFQNSYTRYFNIKNKRHGPLFDTQFKAVRIKNDEQLMHVSRYIHLNPFTSFVVDSFDKLENYQWSSLPDYINEDEGQICNVSLILDLFNSKQDYRMFVLNHADYQRNLKMIKDLVIEN
jgi:putative transposase